MKTIILTIIFAFGDENPISYVVESLEVCEKRADNLVGTRNVKQVICSELRK